MAIKVEVVVQVDEAEWKYSVTRSSKDFESDDIIVIIDSIAKNIKDRIDVTTR